MEDTSGYLSGTPCYPRRDNSAAAGTAGSGVGGGGGGGGGGSDPLDRTWRRYYNKFPSHGNNGGSGGNREHRPSQHSSVASVASDIGRLSLRSKRDAMIMNQPIGPRVALRVRNKAIEVSLAYTRSRSWMLAMSVATLCSCLFYIVGTYLGERGWVLKVEITFGCFFIVDYLLSFVAAPIPLAYAFSWGGAIDLVSCLQVFGSYRRWMATLSFVRYLRLGKAIRVVRNHRLLHDMLNSDDVNIKATLLIVKVLGLVLMTTAILYGTEQASGQSSFEGPQWQWHDALYYTIVTLSTVGYGDITPVLTISRLLTVVVIVFALTYVPVEVTRLVEAMASRPKHREGFSRRLVGSQVHVLLAMADPEGWYDGGGGCGGGGGGGGGSGGNGGGGGGGDQGGAGGGFDRDSLERCIDEFFHEGHGLDKGLLWVVVMSPCAPGPQIQNLLQSPKFMSRVRYFHGSVMDPRDMAAVCAEYADCIFLFPSLRPGGDVRAAEEGVTLAAKALRRYLDRTPTNEMLREKVKMLSETGTPRRTVVTVEEVRSKDQLLGFGIDHVICHDEIKMAMLACGTLCPSFLPFVVNTINSGNGHTGSSGSSSGGGIGDISGSRLSSFGKVTSWLRGRRRRSRRVKGRPSQSTGNHTANDSSINNNDDGGGGGGSGRGYCHDTGVRRRKKCRGWLEDYTDGAAFKLYSIPLDGLPEDSVLRDMSFRRAALTIYEDSDGKVLLLAAVKIVADSYGGGGGGGEGGGYYRQYGGGVRGGWADHIQVEVLPTGKTFRFTESCHLLVLAETKQSAEEWIFDIQQDVYSDDTVHDVDAPPSVTFLSLTQSHPHQPHQLPQPSSPRQTAQVEPSPFLGNVGPSSTHGSTVGSVRAGPTPSLYPSQHRMAGSGAVMTSVATVATAPAVSSSGSGSGGGSDGIAQTDLGGNDGIFSSMGSAAVVSTTSSSSNPHASVVAATVGTDRPTRTTPAAASTQIGSSAAASIATAATPTPAMETSSSASPDTPSHTSAPLPSASSNNELPTVAATVFPLSVSSAPSLASSSPTRNVSENAVNSEAILPTSTTTSQEVTIEGGAPQRPPPLPTLVHDDPLSFPVPENKANSELIPALGSPKSPLCSGGGDGGGGARMPAVMTSWAGLQLDQETSLQLESFRRESRRDDGVNWIEALDALKQAKAQLLELEELSAFGGDELARAVHMSKDPAAFFNKVKGVEESVANVLRVHTSALPPGLSGHIVLVGGHPGLHQYVLALRRQRPFKPVVVVIEKEKKFFEMRKRLEECKNDEPQLNTSKVYHVVGRTQDRATLEAAKISQAEAVVLISYQPSDASVLLESFELEQLLSEMRHGYPRPKVLIDLAKDSSIYYCGLVLGGAGVDSLSQRLLQRHQGGASDGPEPANSSAEDVRHWPLFAAGGVWTRSIMDMFAVQAYFSVHVLAFFETLLQIQPPRPTAHHHSTEQQQQQQQQQQHSSHPFAAALNENATYSAPPPPQQQPGAFSRSKSRSWIDPTFPSSPPPENLPFGDDSGHDYDTSVSVGGGDGGGGCGGWHKRGENEGRGSHGGGYNDGDDSSEAFDQNGQDSTANPGRGHYAHLRVSHSFYNKTYGNLARYLIKHGAMPLGLYRPAGTKGSKLPYAHLNPDRNETLRTWPPLEETRQDAVPEGGRSSRLSSASGTDLAGVGGSGGEGLGLGGVDETGEDFFRPVPPSDFRAGSGGSGGTGPALSAMAPARGDEVFVLRSQTCVLSGEV